MSSQTIIKTKGMTSQSVEISLLQGTGGTTPGAPATGLVFGSMTCYQKSGPTSATTAVTLATLSTETSAYSSGGFKELSSANAPGAYRFDMPNATFTNAGEYDYFFSGSNIAVHHLKVIVTAVDLFNTIASQSGDQTIGTESYPPNGSLYTPNQALQWLVQALQDSDWTPASTTGTLTIRKLDGSTPAGTIQGNDPISPTNMRRAT